VIRLFDGVLLLFYGTWVGWKSEGSGGSNLVIFFLVHQARRSQGVESPE
jgi:hypothetical protein